jgi:hypothetical protein
MKQYSTVKYIKMTGIYILTTEKTTNTDKMEADTTIPYFTYCICKSDFWNPKCTNNMCPVPPICLFERSSIVGAKYTIYST